MKKNKKDKRERIEGCILESILDLNSNNVWQVSENEIGAMWEAEREDNNFSISEEKLLNIIRLSFEVVHYNQNDVREKTKYENGEWITFQHCNAKRGMVAIRKKHITKLSDISYENVRHISPAMLLELIDRNFGGGWESISLPIRDIIESAFDISTTTLPATRMYAAGGTREKKLAQGYEVLEIEKGTWIEAIFAKKKDPIKKLHFNEDLYDEEGNLLKSPKNRGNVNELEGDEDLPEEEDVDVDTDVDEDDFSTENDEELYYSNFSEEAVEKDEDEEGFPIEE